jgi:DNA-binding YbaB/EbfC family protein
MQQMLMRAQKIQREMKKAHDELDAKEFAVSKNGMVELVMLGNRTIKSLKIEPDALDPENVEMLQDTIILAINEANEAITAANDEIEEKITGQTGMF